MRYVVIVAVFALIAALSYVVALPAQPGNCDCTGPASCKCQPGACDCPNCVIVRQQQTPGAIHIQTPDGLVIIIRRPWIIQPNPKPVPKPAPAPKCCP